jgi:hypothetical protein
MKKISVFVAFWCAMFVFASCSEDFKVGAPYKESMVVYGLLDKGDTAHYIKISRAFFDQENNNLLAAKNIDSLYYDSINVVLTKMVNGAVVASNTLQKVNLIDEGIIKDTGIFANQPAYAYKVKTNLDPNFDYKLTITNPKTGKVVTCQTNVMDNDPTTFVISNPQDKKQLSFSDTKKTTDFLYIAPNNAAIIEMYLRFHYTEVLLKNGDSLVTTKFADLPIFTRKDVKTPNAQENFVFEHKNFFNIIAGGIGYENLNVRRYVDTPDVIFYLGGKELKMYIDITNAQGGITADQIQPIFSNMQGDDAYGILSSRVKRVINQTPFSKNTIDSLLYSLDATNLRIVGVSKK